MRLCCYAHPAITRAADRIRCHLGVVAVLEQDEDARKRRARGVTIARDERREAKSERGERGARDDRWEE